MIRGDVLIVRDDQHVVTAAGEIGEDAAEMPVTDALASRSDLEIEELSRARFAKGSLASVADGITPAFAAGAKAAT